MQSDVNKALKLDPFIVTVLNSYVEIRSALS